MSRHWQRDVTDFHRVMDIPIGGPPAAIRRPELRANLIMEEAVETVEAITGGKIEWDWNQDAGSWSPDLPEAIDGMCDTIVVVLGTAVEFGINLQPFWDEVHRSNMAKQGGPTRADGKKLKPPGWKKPDIAGILKQQETSYGL